MNHEITVGKKPLLIVLSGPSGAGKDAILTRVKELDHRLEYVTTVTTRPKRMAERENVDYHFVSTERFQKMVADGELLEWAEVYGNWYGVPKEAIRRALERGRDIVVKVDVQGAGTIKKILSQAVFIFVTPPSLEELAMRLKERRTESSFDLARRIKIAEEEIRQLSLFDYVVMNRRGAVEQAVADVRAIIAAEKCRVAPREVAL